MKMNSLVIHVDTTLESLPEFMKPLIPLLNKARDEQGKPLKWYVTYEYDKSAA